MARAGKTVPASKPTTENTIARRFICHLIPEFLVSNAARIWREFSPLRSTVLGTQSGTGERSGIAQHLGSFHLTSSNRSREGSTVTSDSEPISENQPALGFAQPRLKKHKTNSGDSPSPACGLDRIDERSRKS